MKISQNFNINEFTRSETAIRCGIDNTPPDAVKANLKRLCNEVLEPLRIALGAKIRVTSGYRCEALNNAIGGSATSDHCHGLAVDFIVDGLSVKYVCQKIQRLNLPFNQLIYEFGENGWCHVSIPEFGKEPKRQSLTATKAGSKTIYTEGIK